MSKELEYIENMYNNMYEATKYLEENKDNIDPTETSQSIIEILEQQNEGLEIVYSIKQALIKAQEQEKENAEYKRVIKVIKEKDVFEPTHKYVIEYSKTYDTYCKLFKVYKLAKLKKLTQEEFDLLKRWCK